MVISSVHRLRLLSVLLLSAFLLTLTSCSKKSTGGGGNTEVKAIKPAVQFTMSPSPCPFSLNEYLKDWPTRVASSWVDAVMPQCYRCDMGAYTATISQQKDYYRNNNIPFYPGVLLKSGTYLATDGFLTRMIQQNRLSGFRGECFLFYEGIKDRLPFFQGQYPFIR